MARQTCYFCGKKVDAGEQYCTHCGIKLEGETGGAPGDLSYTDRSADYDAPPVPPTQPPPYSVSPPQYAPGGEAEQGPYAGQGGSMPYQDGAGGSGWAPPPGGGYAPPGAPPPYGQPGPGGYGPGTYAPIPDTSLKKGISGSTAAVIAAVVACVIFFLFVVCMVFLGMYMANRDSSSVESSYSARPDSALSKSEYRELIEEEPGNYEAMVNLAELYCEDGEYEAAISTLLQLSQNGCRERLYYEWGGGMLEEYGEAAGAARVYLLGYGALEDKYLLERAAMAGEPADVIADELMVRALERMLHKPISMISWEDLGEIRSCRLTSSSVSLSRLDPGAASAAEYHQSLTVVEDEDLSPEEEVFYLYGLRNLQIGFTVSAPARIGTGGMPELRALRLYRVYCEDLTPFSDLSRLEELAVGGSSLESLDGLERLESLRSLSLTGTSIEELRGLTACPQLEELALLDNDEIEDFELLATLDGLKSLSLSGKNITSLNFLVDCSWLESLSVTGTEIKEAAFLEWLPLKSLELYGNDSLRDASAVGGITTLETLVFSSRNTAGDSGIASLTGLRSLTLEYPDDLNIVSPLTGLEYLRVCGATTLESIAPVANLTRLETLLIEPGTIKAGSFGSSTKSHYYFSLSPLGSLSGLKRFEMKDVYSYGDSDALFTLSGLETLDVSGSVINAPASFSALSSLEAMNLSGTKFIRNLSIYSDGFFTSIDYDYTDTAAVASALAAVSSLRHLEYRGVELGDIEFVVPLVNLQYLDVSSNYITDITPLVGCPALEYADLSDNPVRDWSVADEFTTLFVDGR